MERILIIGAGVMGSALSVHLANNGHGVNLWGTQWDREIIKEMEDRRYHPALNVDIPENINLFYDDQLEEAFKDARVIIIAVIAKGMKAICQVLKPYFKKGQIILTVSKGLDDDSLHTMSRVVEESLPQGLRGQISIVKLGGPLIAKELAKDTYSEAIFASKDIEAAQYMSILFKSPKFRTSVTEDIDGVEICAAFKNTYAITMGILEGIEGGYSNPKAALMARAVDEMGKIVAAFGGRKETAYGIAGLGDLYVTSLSGRNGRFGQLIGQGKSKDEALRLMDNATVEGLAMTLNGYSFLKALEGEGRINLKEELPLFYQTYQILHQGEGVEKAVEEIWKVD